MFISGATGFVGGYLRESFRSSGDVVWGTAYPEPPCAFGEERIFCVDIRSGEDLSRCIEEARPDRVFHLAAVSNVRHSWQRKRETLETNILGTFHLLEAVRKHAPGARILFVSSSDVYGADRDSAEPLGEALPPRAVDPYAYTKMCGEMLCDFYHRVEGLHVVVARSFPHTGPGQSPDFVCSDWARQVARIENDIQPPTIRVGNLSVQRDFTDVRDVVRAYRLLLEKGRAGEVYNVCSGRGYPLKKILDYLLSLSRERISVEVDETKLRKADIPVLVGDNRKIREELSWIPEIPLERSLEDLLEDWRSRVKAERS